VVATPGQQVRPRLDRVRVDGVAIPDAPALAYLMLNKPVGVLSTLADDRGRPTVAERMPAGTGRVFPVGRLDALSRGLILMTNDGELAVRLMHPRYHVEKEYQVMISGAPAEGAIQQLQKGMRVGADRFLPVEVVVQQRSPLETRLRMVLREGRKCEVRVMWKALGHQVLDLERVRLGPLRLGTLAPGASRPLTTSEVRALRQAAGLTP
jgi:23S rRNA pseudouridine2605 synthase